MKKRILLGCILGTALIMGSAARADTLSDIKAAKVIRIATDLGNPPFGFKNEKLEAEGYDVDSARLLAQDLGVKLELVPTTGPNRIPFLISNRADIIISTLAITPDREKVIDFSKPYAAVLNVLAAPKSMHITGPSDLAGQRIAATRGTTNDVAVTKIAPPTAQIVRFDDEATTLTSVTSGQVKLVAQNPAMVKLMNQKSPQLELESKFTLKQIEFGIGMRKGNDDLKKWINDWISTNLKNGKLNAFYKKYNGVDLPEKILSGS
jgi:polar amino acid transport system substrate-binding protein